MIFKRKFGGEIMDVNLIIALYGAILSSALLIHEVRKERRKLSIILEHVFWVERVQVILTNSGHRPVTITGMTMETMIGEGNNSHWERVPQNSLFDTEQGIEPFPVIIKDGEAISLPLSSVLTGYLLENRLTAKLIIYDSEGRAYSEFKKRTNDAKWGGYDDIKD